MRILLLAMILAHLGAGSAAARQVSDVGVVPGFDVLSEVASLAGAAAADEAKPELRPGRVAAQLAAGFGGELAGFFVGIPVGAAVGAGVALVTPMSTRTGALYGGLVGSLTGIAAGATAGVYLVGARGDETASLPATFGAAAAGTAVGLMLTRLDDTRLGSAIRPLKPLLSLPVLGAATAFLLTRSFRDSAPVQ